MASFNSSVPSSSQAAKFSVIAFTIIFLLVLSYFLFDISAQSERCLEQRKIQTIKFIRQRQLKAFLAPAKAPTFASTFTTESHCGSCVQLNRDSDDKGANICVMQKDKFCQNLAQGWQGGVMDSVSSINTFGSCARLWTDLNCRGDYVDIYPETEEQENLMKINFNDKTKSVGGC